MSKRRGLQRGKDEEKPKAEQQKMVKLYIPCRHGWRAIYSFKSLMAGAQSTLSKYLLGGISYTRFQVVSSRRQVNNVLQ